MKILKKLRLFYGIRVPAALANVSKKPNLSGLITCVFLLLFTSSPIFSQNAEDLAREFITANAEKYDLSADDVKDWIITSEHVSSTSQVHHIFCRQAIGGVGVFNADWSLHITKEGDLLIDHNGFAKGLKDKVRNTESRISAVDAVGKAAESLGYSVSKPIKNIENPRGNSQKQVLSDGGVSTEEIYAQLAYYPVGETYTLAWELYISDLNGDDSWLMFVDANDGKTLDKLNLTVECSPGCNHDHGSAGHDHDHDAELQEAAIGIASASNSAMMGHTYDVYAMPLESPYYGVQTTVTDPANSVASPNGWHDLDGSPGDDSFITFGNNAYAYYGGSANAGYSPTGGFGLDFNFTHTNDPDPFTEQDASLTNLFYWNNVIHDVLVHYGFDEASGNFQNHNYSGLGVSTDFVKASGFTSTWCNATMSTQPDGQSPTMRMYVCSAAGGLKDGNFDNLVVVHEYGHGITKRMVGGAGTTSVLFNGEQMGEGWSDWYGLMLTMGPNDMATDARGVGTWLFNQGAGGAGIRPTPYSTDKTINPNTYADLPANSSTHSRGYIFATMLWEMTWALIDRYGYSSDFYTGNRGNNKAIAIVTEALNMTPSSPGMVDARDAILAADSALYSGANRCLIWKSFAKRGLGLSANQGSPNSSLDGTAAFDIPANCDCAPTLQRKRVANDDQAYDYYGWDVATLGSYSAVGAPYEDAAGSTAGAVYINRINTLFGTWYQSQKITAPDAAAGDQFGRSVAMSGSYLLIGAPYDDDNGSNSGSVYVYRRSGTTYVYEYKITAWDGAANDYFGFDVSVSGSLALIGAFGDDDNGSTSGSAYTFRRNSFAVWNGWQKLTASDGASGDFFGYSLDITRSNFIIGAFGDDDNGSNSGSAYIFNKPLFVGGYSQVAKLTASDASSTDYFGRAVAISGNKAIVGAYRAQANSSGAAYTFKNTTGTTWVETQILVADDAAASDYFGYDVGILGDRAVVGSRLDDDNGSSSGSAYVFNYLAGYWCQAHKLTASDAAAGDGFGFSTEMATNYVIVGAPYNDDGGTNSGSAYLFSCSFGGLIYEEEYEDLPPNQNIGQTKDELSTEFEVEIFPNPNPGKELQLSMSGVSDDDPRVLVSVYDAFGKLIYQNNLVSDNAMSNSTLTFDQPLAKGFYTVLIESNKDQIVKKLIVN